MGDSPRTDCACPAPQGLWLPWLLFHATSGPQPLYCCIILRRGRARALESHSVWFESRFRHLQPEASCSTSARLSFFVCKVGMAIRMSWSCSERMGCDWRASGVLAAFPCRPPPRQPCHAPSTCIFLSSWCPVLSLLKQGTCLVQAQFMETSGRASRRPLSERL